MRFGIENAISNLSTEREMEQTTIQSKFYLKVRKASTELEQAVAPAFEKYREATSSALAEYEEKTTILWEEWRTAVQELLNKVEGS